MVLLLVCTLHQLKTPWKAVSFPLVGIQRGFIFRRPSGEIRAFANVCPHRGLELDVDENDDYFDQENIHCKVHDAKFDSLTGQFIRGPKTCQQKRLFPLEVVVAPPPSQDDDQHAVYVRFERKDMLDFKRDFFNL